MITEELLAHPMVQTLPPAVVFALLKWVATAEQFKQRITSHMGSPMLECFAELVHFDAQLDASLATQAD